LHAKSDIAAELAWRDLELDRLRELVLAVYVGPAAVHDLPEPWLDALIAAGHGEPFSTDELIPYNPTPTPEGGG
jgi:hypothetical protein